MKLSGAKSEAYLKSADEVAPITLVFSADEARARREIQDKMKRALGSNASEDMRLHQFQSKEIISDPAMLGDALQTKSFFPGPCGVIIFGATDALAKPLMEVFDTWQGGDAKIFIQAGNLTKASKLRKALEPHKSAMVIGLYEDPMTPMKANGMIDKTSIRLNREARDMLSSLGTELNLYEFERLLESIELYQGDAEELDIETLEPLLPTGLANSVDDIINQLLTGQNGPLVKNLKRAPAQGVSVHQILAMTNIQVKNILSVKAAKDSQSAISTMRPPLFGTRRDRFMTQLRIWPLHAIELALQVITDTERTVRSGTHNIPIESYVERQFLKICLMARKNKGA